MIIINFNNHEYRSSEQVISTAIKAIGTIFNRINIFLGLPGIPYNIDSREKSAVFEIAHNFRENLKFKVTAMMIYEQHQ